MHVYASNSLTSFNDTTKTITVSVTTALSGLTTNVTISSPANNNVLQYNGSKWINTTISVYLSTLIDCFITSPSNGQLLQYNGTKWKKLYTYNPN